MIDLPGKRVGLIWGQLTFTVIAQFTTNIGALDNVDADIGQKRCGLIVYFANLG